MFLQRTLACGTHYCIEISCNSNIFQYLWYSASISYAVKDYSKEEITIHGYSNLFVGFTDQWTSLMQSQDFNLRIEHRQKIPYPQS